MLKPISALIIATAAASNVGQAWTHNSTVGTAVNTTSGLVVGHANQKYLDVSEYLGVPFAKPPVHNLRFAPPEAYVGSARIVADKQPLSCTQKPSSVNYSQPLDWINMAITAGIHANHTSEDCLYLNVWTKFPALGGPLKPVLIWVFGGGFHSGGANDNSQQGGIFAEEQDVVIVSFNYRLGIFGFPGAPDNRQNLALLDQRLAVEWVRDNIAGFGGDPDRIILFGHSAGGASVDYYNFAWQHDPIISGSGIMSGNVFSFGNRLANTSADAWYATASIVGCGNTTSTSNADIMACMRTKDTAPLFNASLTAGLEVTNDLSQIVQLYIGVTGIFGPVIDGITVFANYTARSSAREFIQRPIITGSNDDEACYVAERGTFPSDVVGEITTNVWTCPTWRTAGVRVQAGVPAWQYRFFGAYPNTYANACPGRPWHGEEVDVMFGSTVAATLLPATSQEVDMGWWYRQAFSAFAHNPEQGLTDMMGWPCLTKQQDTVMVLGLNHTLSKFENAEVWNKPCAALPAAPNY